jgi:protein gp37
MPLNKSKGNMYNWISHTHTHLAGKCPHACLYCSIQDMASVYPNLKEKYSGPLRLIEKEFDVKYGNGKTIFIENCNDLFAEEVLESFILRVLDHCNDWPENTYVFQTKNPARYKAYLDYFPPNFILGTTIETNRYYPWISKAPFPVLRYEAMMRLPAMTKNFITLEPILDFDVNILTSWIKNIHPDFINLGADSKNHGLPEPTVEKIMAFTERLKDYGIDLREKHNLARLKP